MDFKLEQLPVQNVIHWILYVTLPAQVHPVLARMASSKLFHFIVYACEWMIDLLVHIVSKADSLA